MPPGPPTRDPLLDPPRGAPGWLPSVDREPSLRWLQRAVLVVLLVGVGACVVRGADRPADPTLGPPAGPATTSPPLEVPGTADGDEPGEGAAPPAQAEPPGGPDRVPFGGFGEVALTVVRPDGDLLTWCLLAAIEAAQRARGMMEVTDLQGYDGMAFLFDDDVTNAFFMRNTPMPLSIAWVADDGTLVGTADMDPCPDQDGCPTYPPPGPYRFAIEVPQGGLAERGIVPGADIRVGGPCAARTGT